MLAETEPPDLLHERLKPICKPEKSLSPNAEPIPAESRRSGAHVDSGSRVERVVPNRELLIRAYIEWLTIYPFPPHKKRAVVNCHPGRRLKSRLEVSRLDSLTLLSLKKIMTDFQPDFQTKSLHYPKELSLLDSG